MSFFETASLIYIADFAAASASAVSGSGTNTGKAYSIKPTDGSGDFTFERGSDITATRVNSSGLIEKGRGNLLKYSEEFDNPYYSKLLGTLTTNQTTAPDGSLTADLFTKTSGVNTVSELQASGVYPSTGIFTFSVYVKQNVGDDVLLRLDFNGNTANASFQFSTKSISTIGSNVIDATATELANGWFRLSVTGNVTNTSWSLSIVNLFSNPTNDSIFVWGAQLEQGLVATDYIETTTTPLRAGLLEDEPRFDYHNSASATPNTCPSLLLEPERTNLITNSEYYNGWTQSGTTLTTNTTETLSPEGLYNASKLVGNGTTGVINSGIAKTGSVVVSVYLKSVSGSVNVTFKDPYGGLANEVKSVTTEWQRFDFIGDNGFSFAGFWIDDIPASGIYMWGAQLEQGSYPTSYIPTYGTAATRGGDNCFLNSTSILEQTSATYFLETTPEEITSNNFIDARGASSTNNRILWQTNSGGALRILVRAQGSSILDQNISNAVANDTKVKIALKYTPTNITVYVDGVKKIDTDVSVDFSPEINGIDLEGSATSNDDPLRHHQFLFFPEALSDTDCEILTGATTYSSFAAMASALNYTVYE